jgi:hypothetical protein
MHGNRIRIGYLPLGLAGALLFGVACAATWKGFSGASRGSSLTLQRNALPSPPSAAAPLAAPGPGIGDAETPTAEPAPEPPRDDVPVDLPVEEPGTADPAPVPADAVADGQQAGPEARHRDESAGSSRRSTPRRTSDPALAPAAASDPQSPGMPAGKAVCQVCGRPVESWAEVDGRRIGYCRRHMARVTRSRRPRRPAAPPAAGPPVEQEPTDSFPVTNDDGAASGKIEPVQCQGLTKSGARCRRRTTDPSGYCYQHRAR